MNDLDTFFMLLFTAYGKKLYERESLIIFDEVPIRFRGIRMGHGRRDASTLYQKML